MTLTLKIFLYPAIVLLGALALFAFRNAKKIFAKYRRFEEVEHDPEWDGFIRKDFNKWDQKKILIGCVLRFPLRFLLCLYYLFGLSSLILFSRRFQCLGRKMQIIFVKFMKRVLFTWVFEVEELNKIESVSTPIVIANHVSWMDVVYLVTRLYPVSIVAKDEISNALLVGSIAKYLQCLFISRESKDARKELLEQIKERVLQYQPSVNVNPLLIFPEGTTSNGRSILRFKLGAFAEKPKITIFGLIYDCQGFDLGMDQITPLEHLIIAMSLRPTLKVKTAQMEPLQNQTPEDYMQRCQEKMRQLTGFPVFNTGYTEKCAFKEKRQMHKKD